MKRCAHLNGKSKTGDAFELAQRLDEAQALSHNASGENKCF